MLQISKNKNNKKKMNDYYDSLSINKIYNLILKYW